MPGQFRSGRRACSIRRGEVHETCISIDAQDVVIPNGGSLTLRAPDQVSFQPDFKARTGGALTVDIAVP